MGILEVLLIAVSVSIDAFAVSVSGALCDRSGRRWRNAFWAALFFGSFQILMPVIGFLPRSCWPGWFPAAITGLRSGCSGWSVER